MELKKSKIAELFKVTVLTVDSWERKGKIKRIENIDSVKYSIPSVLKMAKENILLLEEKKKILNEAVSFLEFEIEQDKIYLDNIEKYKILMAKK